MQSLVTDMSAVMFVMRTFIYYSYSRTSTELDVGRHIGKRAILLITAVYCSIIGRNCQRCSTFMDLIEILMLAKGIRITGGPSMSGLLAE